MDYLNLYWCRTIPTIKHYFYVFHFERHLLSSQTSHKTKSKSKNKNKQSPTPQGTIKMFPYNNKGNDVVEQQQQQQRRRRPNGTNGSTGGSNIPFLPTSLVYLPPLPVPLSTSTSSVIAGRNNYDFHTVNGVVDILQAVLEIIHDEVASNDDNIDTLPSY